MVLRSLFVLVSTAAIEWVVGEPLEPLMEVKDEDVSRMQISTDFHIEEDDELQPTDVSEDPLDFDDASRLQTSMHLEEDVDDTAHVTSPDEHTFRLQLTMDINDDSVGERLQLFTSFDHDDGDVD